MQVAAVEKVSLCWKAECRMGARVGCKDGPLFTASACWAARCASVNFKKLKDRRDCLYGEDSYDQAIPYMCCVEIVVGRWSIPLLCDFDHQLLV